MEKSRVKNEWDFLCRRQMTVAIYVLLLLFFVVKVEFYEQYVGHFPDEQTQMTYVTYLELENKIIPDFREMPLNISEQAVDGMFEMSGTNYLGHPPLFYNILNLFCDITSDGVIDDSDWSHLRMVSQFIVYIGLIMAFYLGYTKIKKNWLHLLYGTIVISVPMFAYSSAGINNDALSFTGMVLFFIAVLRLLEKRESYLSYILFASAVFIVMMNKMSGATILILSCIGILGYTMIKEKSISILWNKRFLVTVPIYLVVMAYYIMTYVKYGAFHPSLKVVNPEAFYNSGFYIAEELRTYMSFRAYIRYYWTSFFLTWTGIASHISLIKTGTFLAIQQIGLFSILFLPILSLKNKVKQTEVYIMLMIYGSTMFAMFTQFIRCYTRNFIGHGYMGGYQSRYYLCILFIMAFCICYAIYDRYQYLVCTYQEKVKTVECIFATICIGFSGLLIYEDFIYFLLHYTNYL